MIKFLQKQPEKTRRKKEPGLYIDNPTGKGLYPTQSTDKKDNMKNKNRKQEQQATEEDIRRLVTTDSYTTGKCSDC